MQEYSFISIAVTRTREGAALAKDYRVVIQDQARAGWSFVQAIPFESHAEPRLDLVFVRKANQ